ncbi:MAG: biopolymer transporter ExbD [Bdellovibrionales bacterium]|nr:biopolymer transporter ExbD [Bdellovibrionales bacterium]
MKFTDESLFQDDVLDINITPLIDVVFILLIFFMVTTTFDDHAGLKVQLPKAQQRQASDETSKLLSITVSKSGGYFVGSKELTPTQLESRLKQHAQSSGDATVVIRADEHTDHGTVVRVMDMAKTQGIAKLAIATQPKQ